MLLDCISVAGGLWLSSLIRPWLNQFTFIEVLSPPFTIPADLYIIFPLIWLFIYASFSIYDGKKFLRAVDEFAALTIATVIASISSAGILYFSFRNISRALFVVFIVLTYLFTILWRVFVRLYFRKTKETSPNYRRVLIVGSGSLGQRIEEQINRKSNRNITCVGFLDDRPEKEFRVIGELSDVRELISRLSITDVVIALPFSAYSEIGQIVKKLDKSPVQIWVALGFFDLALYKTGIEDFAGIPMLDLRASAIDDYQRMTKRVFDVVLSVIGLILTTPLLALISLCIFLEDGRPVLFHQKRVGENGRLFTMYKFRTMVKNAEDLRETVEKKDDNGNLIHKSRHDNRVTRVGRVLRRFSLDELPQLFNILHGTMSMVGPRPEMSYLVEKYQPWQCKRFAVPPGLTGWWQVNGRSDRPMHLHTEDDLFYIQNYSIWLDIQILVRTVWVVLFGKGSY